MFKQIVRLALLAPVCLTIGGCATAVVGSLTLSQISTIATVTTMTVKGKGVGEVAMDVATGKDCRVMEGLVRQSRAICELPGSRATDGDFKGVLALLQRDETDDRPEVLLVARTSVPASRLVLGQDDDAGWAYP